MTYSDSSYFWRQDQPDQPWRTRSLCKDLTCFWAVVQTLFWIEPRITCEYWNEMSVMMSRSRLICWWACVTWWCILTSSAPAMTLPSIASGWLLTIAITVPRHVLQAWDGFWIMTSLSTHRDSCGPSARTHGGYILKEHEFSCIRTL